MREHFGHEQLQVDAFVAGGIFTGNPAAVVFTHRDDQWMQNVATENNLAETSFLQRIGVGQYKLRWFTPVREVELCGHATLAAAHALYETHREPRGTILSFHTVHSGVLAAAGQVDGSITLSFPATPVSPYTMTETDTDKATSALGIDKKDIVYAGKSIYDTFIEISSDAFDSLSNIAYSAFEHFGGRGVIVTARGEGVDKRTAGCHFRSRCFFPL
ncbi:PhzF family phenazine biosynthesis protein [archaeon]|nr:MAG: PhzF family phenazine biosynthesis protein [archaeon]